MILNAEFASQRRSPRNGFSLVELVLSLAVLLIITTMAVPVVVRSLQSYRLNATASQLAGMLKYAKFDAIRQNTPVGCQIVQSGTNWLIWVDSNGNNAADQAEPQMYVGGSFTLLPEGSPLLPDPGPIKASLGPGGSSLPWTVQSGSNATIWYDHRGVVVSDNVGGPVITTVYALYIGNPNDASSGFRAIITLPSGAVQVWASSGSGNWWRVS